MRTGTAARRGDWSAAKSVPTATTFLLLIAAVLPFRVPDYATVTPLFVLAAIYYWTIYRPELLPPLAVFVSGLTLDLLTGAPLGVSSLLLLLARTLVLTQRRFFVDRLFPFVWGGFTLLAAAAIAFLWLLGSLLEGAMLDMRAAALQWVLTVACFPAVGYLLMRIQRAFMSAV
ncbi:MAG TPA: rod shape-determining protein MreD [Stellaceae bacterium]|nr:rod shape-determining protein MreD [Stellaceae bacterium]